MNTTLKVFLGFTGGAVVGSLATYYIVRESFRKQADDQVESIRKSFIEKYANVEPNIPESVESMEVDDYVHESFNTIKEMTGKTPVFLEDLEEEDYEEVNPVETPSGVEEIDKAEFFNSFDEKNGADNLYKDYSEISLTYYTDGVLADDREDDVTDQKDMYFMDIDLESYIPGDTLYFVNHTHMFKIELTVSEQSYKHDVLGEGEEDEEVDWGDVKTE